MIREVLLDHNELYWNNSESQTALKCVLDMSSPFTTCACISVKEHYITIESQWSARIAPS